MTSEVVIMNKNAIVMAADSAVTVGGTKTYNGVNKLFILSNSPPMGIMIFGSADFENIPMETLIKEFKRKTDFKKCNDIEMIKDEFLKFLSENTPKTDIKNKIEITLPLFKNFMKLELENIPLNDFEEFIISQGNRKLPDFLNEIDELNNYNYKFEELIPDELNSNQHDLLIDSLKNIFFDYISSISTGIVIAGFNQNEMFPSCMHYNIHFNYNKDIKISNFDYLANFEENVIIPFAQQDVMKTFISGIDENIKYAITIYFHQFTEEYLKQLKNKINSNKKIKNGQLNVINQEIDKFIDNCEDQSQKFFKNMDQLEEIFTQPILDSIGGLPKNELANMGESLIHITSLKRKISAELESVGGDIDVAIISKGDGFIWKRQKQYFESELNPQFFERND